ncbi:MAG: hypothetical protein OEZ01_00650 [Candidatus Heimdallarchaeota archaeon]|nr:hypothetical protein [Candidatus Heimdallarchaeota archaeon]MDH5644481.1 hypothetical protein [Candidatus Heimdallarchaeota archaeon]
MIFQNLALTGWSYEKGDKKLAVADLDIPKRILIRNPVDAIYVYEDESIWQDRLQHHVRNAVKMAEIDHTDIQGFMGVHNGYKKHISGASDVTMGAFPDTEGFMFDFSLGCASVVLSAQLAGLHFSTAEVNNVAVGNVQFITQYTHNYSDGNSLFADSIGALVYSKRSKGNMVRFTEITSNAEFRDMFVFDDEAKYSLANLQKGVDLTKFMIKSFGGHMRKGCVSMKIMPKDIDFIAISCSTYQATKTVLEAMQFPLERTGLECLTKVPHMGMNDIPYQIEFGIEQGLIKPGSKILVSGTGLGFSIATMAIEWGT